MCMWLPQNRYFIYILKIFKIMQIPSSSLGLCFTIYNKYISVIILYFNTQICSLYILNQTHNSCIITIFLWCKHGYNDDIQYFKKINYNHRPYLENSKSDIYYICVGYLIYRINLIYFVML